MIFTHSSAQQAWFNIRNFPPITIVFRILYSSAIKLKSLLNILETSLSDYVTRNIVLFWMTIKPLATRSPDDEIMRDNAVDTSAGRSKQCQDSTQRTWKLYQLFLVSSTKQYNAPLMFANVETSNAYSQPHTHSCVTTIVGPSFIYIHIYIYIYISDVTTTTCNKIQVKKKIYLNVGQRNRTRPLCYTPLYITAYYTPGTRGFTASRTPKQLKSQWNCEHMPCLSLLFIMDIVHEVLSVSKRIKIRSERRYAGKRQKT